MLISVLDSDTIGNDLDYGILSRFGEVAVYHTTSNDELLNRIKESDVIILNKIRITDSILCDHGKLRLICVFATGYDGIDIEAAKMNGVAVCNVPGYSTPSVTLFTVGIALSLILHLPEYSEYVASGRYTASGISNKITPIYHDLSGKRWGIIGYGNIGSSVARVVDALGAEVVVHTRTKTNDYPCLSLDDLCQSSDVISIHCPLTKDTRHLINEANLSLMKTGAVVVNMARGSVIDENAVANAIVSGKIAAFGSDVYSEEPFDSCHPFNRIKDYSNVILTPHTAWASYESRVRCLNIISDNILSYFRGNYLNRVDI